MEGLGWKSRVTRMIDVDCLNPLGRRPNRKSMGVFVKCPNLPLFNNEQRSNDISSINCILPS